MPSKAGAITFSTFFTAFVTPFPPNRFDLLSRSSSASRVPVEAPEGTIARPTAPQETITSASTVGLPLESRTSLALISIISVILPSHKWIKVRYGISVITTG